MRLIDADALYFAQRYARADPESEKLIPVLAVDREDVEQAPTIEAATVRHGVWIRDHTYTGKHKQKYVCSLCTHFQMNKRSYKDTCALYMNYCPQCGAKMDGDSNV